MYNLWPCPSIFLVSSVTVAWVAVTCCAVCCLSFPRYTFMSYVYPVESQSLKILMSKRLRFFGMYCLKITLPLKETITSSTARFSAVCQKFCLSYQVHSCCHQNVSNEGCEFIGPGDYQCQQSVQIFRWPTVTAASCFIDSFYANAHTDYQMLNWK